MKIIYTLLLASSLAAVAQAPRKDPGSKYSQLWRNSLVTKKPVVETEPEEKVTALDDFVLGGWTQTTQGYLVALINTKNPKERKTIAPGMPNKHGFQVIEVKRDPKDYKATQVLVKAGADQKWIGYEDKFLTIQQPASARQAQRKPTTKASPTKPPIPGATQRTNSSGQRTTPRVRRVPVPPKK